MISSRCDGCGGEDCVCCEVWLEQQYDDRYANDYYADDGQYDYYSNVEE
jgi:hypothetical protein